MKPPFKAGVIGLGEYQRHMVFDANIGQVCEALTKEDAEQLARLLNKVFEAREHKAALRLLAFANLVSDFFASDSSGHGQYLKEQADNAIAEVKQYLPEE